MPMTEKLLTLELLWDEISLGEEGLEVPDWHKEILDERERLVAEGKAKFIDWNEAKARIKNAVR
jgi:hypothetical protein